MDVCKVGECLLALAKKGDREVFEALDRRGKALMKTDPWVYSSLMTARLRSEDESAVAAVRGMLESKDTTARRDGIDFIRSSGNAKLAVYLKPLLDEKGIVIKGDSGGINRTTLGEYAAEAICDLAGGRMRLWDFDPERRRREIEKWFAVPTDRP